MANANATHLFEFSSCVSPRRVRRVVVWSVIRRRRERRQIQDTPLPPERKARAELVFSSMFGKCRGAARAAALDGLPVWLRMMLLCVVCVWIWGLWGCCVRCGGCGVGVWVGGMVWKVNGRPSDGLLGSTTLDLQVSYQDRRTDKERYSILELFIYAVRLGNATQQLCSRGGQAPTYAGRQVHLA